ncbi:TPA: hypothetical protein KOX18_004215 [Clostridioides difficile]|nr:hypothetical protein [Clostridioides difficile]HBF7456158.1 hypothetical protein [Clostridioides difficile]
MCHWDFLCLFGFFLCLFGF